ncbi:MAG: hypothetical protein AAGA87_13830 [Pseudomonadota bacterium]
MRHVFAMVLCLAATPVAAEDAEEGLDLIDRGARMLFQELMEQVEPGLREFAEQMDPAMEQLRGLLGDINAYHPPEVLPNGDIIIRRKEPLRPEEAVPEGGIEL